MFNATNTLYNALQRNYITQQDCRRKSALINLLPLTHLFCIRMAVLLGVSPSNVRATNGSRVVGNAFLGNGVVDIGGYH